MTFSPEPHPPFASECHRSSARAPRQQACLLPTASLPHALGWVFVVAMGLTKIDIRLSYRDRTIAPAIPRSAAIG
jgi:hypothetical protein